MARPADIQATLLQVMAGRTRVPIRELVADLRAAGVRLPKSAVDATDLVFDVLERPGQRWMIDLDEQVSDLGAVMDGVTLTHRLRQEEVESGVLRLGFDFAPSAMTYLEVTGLVLPDGSSVPMDLEARELTLAPTTLPDLARKAGDLIGITFTASTARLIAVDDVADDRNVMNELSRRMGRSWPQLLLMLAETLLTDTDVYREPHRPLPETLRDEGFTVAGGLVALFEEQLDETLRAGLIDELRAEFELTEREAASLADVIHAIQLLEPRTPDGLPRLEDLAEQLASRELTPAHLRASLRDPWLAEVTAMVVLDESAPYGVGLAALLNLLREAPGAPATREERASLEYLKGRCQEFAGNPLAAELSFRNALALAPDHGAALVGLAGIAVSRSEFGEALRLLDRAGAAPRHPLRTAIAASPAQESEPERLPGRNEPCWCGSGRKFKACHARSTGRPLSERMLSLPARVLAWRMLTDGRLFPRLIEKVLIAGGQPAVGQMVELVPDLIGMEGGGLADFLERRGALLADDEVMTGELWLLRPRSLFEVEEVTPGEGMLLRDLLTGDRHQVRERSASRQLTAGTMLVTRVAPIGDGDVIFGGGIPIDLHERSQFIELLTGEPTAEEIVSVVAQRFRGPAMATAEGDSLLFVQGTLTTTSPRRLSDALDAALDSSEDGWQLSEPGMMDGQRVLATLRLQGRTLTVETMSEARYERVLAILDDLDVPLVERSLEVKDPMDTVAEGGSAADGPPSRTLDPNTDPRAREIMSQLIAQYESDWLDESIPALDGVTPRAAAADPTRREDLIRLLDTFPANGSPLEMDGSRLRAALGL